jgi:hypothetical protein
MFALLAASFASMRAVEAVAARIRPEASYARKLLAGLAVGLGVFVLVSALLFECWYVAGMFQKGNVEGGLAGVADARWFTTNSSSTTAIYSLERAKAESLPALALPFGIAAFARARRLPLREQVGLVGAFMVLWYGPALVYCSMAESYHGKYELAVWVLAWVSNTTVPLHARLGDDLEEKLLPEELREGDAD